MDNLSRAVLGGSLDGAEGRTLELLLDLGREIVGADEGSLLVVDEAARELVFVITRGNATSERALRGQRIPFGRGPTGLAAATGEPQAGAPLLHAVGQVPIGEGAVHEPESVLAAPMLVGDRVVGVITAVSFDGARTFGARDVRLYGTLAAIGASIVDQQQRLGVIEARDDRAAGPMHRITGSLARIGATDAAARSRVAVLLESIEQLVRP